MTDEPENIPVAEWTSTGMVILPDATFEEWKEHLDRAIATHQCINWVLGDALVFGDDHFEEFSQVVDARWAEQHREKMWLCRRIPKSRRIEGLSWSVHRVVGKMDPE